MIRTVWYVNNKHSGWNVVADIAPAATLPRNARGKTKVTTKTPKAPRKMRDADATREEILRVATEVFAKNGLHGARVEELASLTATSKHMIYYYFGSKEGLYAAVLDKAYKDFRTAESALDYEALTPSEALRAIVGITFDSHQANPHVVRIIMSENLDHGRHLQGSDQAQQRGQVLATLERIIQRGQASGEFRADIDALHLHMTISALCFHFIANRYTFGTIFAVDQTDPVMVQARRAEVVSTLMARCLKGGAA
ncbi:TetR family transcriptional regulator [Novosphingobium umbonatum]|uniref:TetR family transcriptional regulator n=2 Tax=Novosphingobium umbonatum TaxID=1908524 RepID=A0A3S2VWQ3_9SPHN|nr:TetR family transcriptional regulator [Novosphingobium umbonatum]